MMEKNVCKKCKKTLPEGYKYDKCEACRNKLADGIKKGLKVVAGVAGIVIVAVIPFINKDEN